MGFSLTGTQVIFFVASVIVAGAVSGVFIAVTTDVSNSFSDRGDRLQEQLDTDFKIINDNENIPNVTGFYHFYLKNIGSKKIITTNETFILFIDGELVPTANFSFSDISVKVGDVVTILVHYSDISSGVQKLRIVGPQAVEDEFEFTI